MSTNDKNKILRNSKFLPANSGLVRSPFEELKVKIHTLRNPMFDAQVAVTKALGAHQLIADPFREFKDLQQKQKILEEQNNIKLLDFQQSKIRQIERIRAFDNVTSVTEKIRKSMEGLNLPATNMKTLKEQMGKMRSSIDEQFKPIKTLMNCSLVNIPQFLKFEGLIFKNEIPKRLVPTISDSLMAYHASSVSLAERASSLMDKKTINFPFNGYFDLANKFTESSFRIASKLKINMPKNEILKVQNYFDSTTNAYLNWSLFLERLIDKVEPMANERLTSECKLNGFEKQYDEEIENNDINEKEEHTVSDIMKFGEELSNLILDCNELGSKRKKNQKNIFGYTHEFFRGLTSISFNICDDLDSLKSFISHLYIIFYENSDKLNNLLIANRGYFEKNECVYIDLIQKLRNKFASHDSQIGNDLDVENDQKMVGRIFDELIGHSYPVHLKDFKKIQLTLLEKGKEFLLLLRERMIQKTK